jgi:hypothetical protein
MKNLFFLPFLLLAMIFLIIYAWFPEKKDDLEIAE